MSFVEAYMTSRADYVDAMRAFDALASRVRWADVALRKSGINATAKQVELPESHHLVAAMDRAKAAHAIMLECWAALPKAMRGNVHSPTKDWRAA